MNFKKFFFVLTHWEKWHYHVKYIPLYPAWVWYCIRSGSWWWFTPSNPSLTFGGFEGESKKEMYDQLPQQTFPKSIFISPSISFSEVEMVISENNFEFPFAVKPDVGMMGFMFRKIDSVDELKRYHEMMSCNYIIQELIKDPIEVSVFYYRFPYEQKGTITGFIKKEMLDVTGDGITTLGELMLQLSSRPGFKIEEWRTKHSDKLNDVIPNGETFRLSWAANLSRGGRLISLEHEKDERLLKVFDDISNYTKHFYYGRYDIKCNSIDELKQGSFSILEFNGCGAEPHHVYGNGNNLIQAYKIILHHWKVLYNISRYNRKQGIHYWKFSNGYKFLRDAKEHFKTLKQLDQNFN